jgi:hypothetical protein
MARYSIKASSHGENVVFENQTLEAALRKAAELLDAHVQHITLVNTVTGMEITNLEDLIRGLEPPEAASH